MEKEDVFAVETISPQEPFDREELNKTIRRMDLITLPVVTLLLGLCFIDRANMGLANVAGMGSELKLVGYQYSIALLTFFPGYAVFAIPSNYILVKTSVRYWLSFLAFGFGAFTLGMGFVRNFHTLAILRLFLGVCEAG